MTLIIIAGLLNFAGACRPSQTSVIGKNVDPDVVNLKNANTFDWSSEVDKIPDDREFISPTRVFQYEATIKLFKNAIAHELNARGYKLKDSGTNPGMLVSFRIIKWPDTLRKTGGVITVQGAHFIDHNNIEYVPVLPGTLIVNLIDNDKNKMVWQGFASGIIKANHINDKQKIRQAVASIFGQFNYNSNNK